jgi:hypothetical protein
MLGSLVVGGDAPSATFITTRRVWANISLMRRERPVRCGETCSDKVDVSTQERATPQDPGTPCQKGVYPRHSAGRRGPSARRSPARRSRHSFTTTLTTRPRQPRRRLPRRVTGTPALWTQLAQVRASPSPQPTARTSVPAWSATIRTPTSRSSASTKRWRLAGGVGP